MKIMEFQRKNPYNKFLPYASDLEDDADKYLSEVISDLKRCLTETRPKLNITEVTKCLTKLQKYQALHGMRYTLDDHLFFIKTCYGLFCTDNVSPLDLIKYGEILVSLVKKKYLIVNSGLVLDWKPLFELLYKYEDSSEAARGMQKSPAVLRMTIRSVIKFTRSFFSEESTQVNNFGRSKIS
jgi:proteasome activator subunit 4